jgi:post-segregation antitoxin (ccd killing protein)
VHPELVYKSGVTAQRVTVPEDVLARCREIGATLAAAVAAGIY